MISCSIAHTGSFDRCSSISALLLTLTKYARFLSSSGTAVDKSSRILFMSSMESSLRRSISPGGALLVTSFTSST